jgi:TonB family protein
MVAGGIGKHRAGALYLVSLLLPSLVYFPFDCSTTFIHLAMIYYALAGPLRRWHNLFKFLNLCWAFLYLSTLNAQTPGTEVNSPSPVLMTCTEGDSETQQRCTRETILDSIKQKMHFPEVARIAGKSGTVQAKIHINKKGEVDHVLLLASAGWGMDEEAVRLLHRLPGFKPLVQDGKVINSQMIVPVIFELDKTKAPRTITVNDFKLIPQPNTGTFELSFYSNSPPDSIVTINPETYEENVYVT